MNLRNRVLNSLEALCVTQDIIKRLHKIFNMNITFLYLLVFFNFTGDKISSGHDGLEHTYMQGHFFVSTTATRWACRERRTRWRQSKRPETRWLIGGVRTNTVIAFITKSATTEIHPEMRQTSCFFCFISLTFCWPCISVCLSQFLTNLMHKICFTVSFISCLYMFRAHVLIIRRSKLHYTDSGIITPIGGRLVHGTATYRGDDTRGCVMQFWPPDDKHMCSKHVEAWNKTYCETDFVHQVG